MALDLGVKGCTAALYNMCVEPDGGVLPCQSYYHPLGNFLVDGWDSIWNHELAVRLRERNGLPQKCTGCSLLAECGGAKGRKTLAEKTGLSEARLLSWVNMADLIRVSGIGPEFSELLEAAGVTVQVNIQDRDTPEPATDVVERTAAVARECRA